MKNRLLKSEKCSFSGTLWGYSLGTNKATITNKVLLDSSHYKGYHIFLEDFFK